MECVQLSQSECLALHKTGTVNGMCMPFFMIVAIN